MADPEAAAGVASRVYTAVTQESEVQEQGAVQPGDQARATEEQLHVAGVLVHAVAAEADAIRAFIATLPGAAVHGAAEGKLVVTLEAATSGVIMDRLSAIRDRRGVLSALPVYQHNEPAAQIDEEENYGN